MWKAVLENTYMYFLHAQDDPKLRILRIFDGTFHLTQPKLYFTTSGPAVIKLFSCSTQLSMKFVLLINLKLLTVANSFLLNIAEYENFSANKYENANNSWYFHIY